MIKAKGIETLRLKLRSVTQGEGLEIAAVKSITHEKATKRFYDLRKKKDS